MWVMPGPEGWTPNEGVLFGSVALDVWARGDARPPGPGVRCPRFSVRPGRGHPEGWTPNQRRPGGRRPASGLGARQSCGALGNLAADRTKAGVLALRQGHLAPLLAPLIGCRGFSGDLRHRRFVADSARLGRVKRQSDKHLGRSKPKSCHLWALQAPGQRITNTCVKGMFNLPRKEWRLDNTPKWDDRQVCLIPCWGS
jgi:hypothetical protein